MKRMPTSATTNSLKGHEQSQRQFGYCPLCISRCGIVSVVENGRLVAVEADPEHPTGNSVCVKGRAAPELVYAPERVLTPMRRTRPKGDADPGWRPISWDEALTEIATKLQDLANRHGPESVAFGVATPSGTAVADAFAWIHRLARAFGSPNILFATENCNWHRDFGAALTFGSGIGMPDFENTDCIVLWGTNPATSWPAMAQIILAATRRGAKLVAIDPRQVGLASRADIWLDPRPGTDGALALALLNVMLVEGWYDRDFLLRRTNGPLLVRADNGRLLTQADVEGTPGKKRFLAWHTGQQAPITHDPDDLQAPWALAGEFTVETLTGPVSCRPAFSLLQDICAPWSPQRAEEETGVQAKAIREAAHLMYHSRPISWYGWTGTCQHADATQTTRAISLLFALMGGWDDVGGNRLFAKPPLRDVSGLDLLPDAQKAKTLGLESRPWGPPSRGWITSRDLGEAVMFGKPYPVKGLVSFGSNPLLTKPSTPDFENALVALDFFVLADMVMTPTARFADILLPVASPWEREGIQAGFMIGREADCLLQLRTRVLSPLGESRSDTRIVFDLAAKLGLSEQFFGSDPEDGLAYLLRDTGQSAQRLRNRPQGVRLSLQTAPRKYEEAGFATPTGLVELYSMPLLEIGQQPIPEYKPRQPQRQFPLVLTTAKWPQFCHSQQRHLPSLRQRMPQPLVEIAPADADARAIEEGNEIEIITGLGRVRALARLNAKLKNGVVCAQYGWWPENLNAVIPGDVFDLVSGSNILKSCPCNIRKL